jgi:hypothetical protein
MHSVNLVVVHSCNSQHEAEMAKGALESAGISAMIQADSVGGMRHHVAWATGGFKVMVREEDVEDGLAVLGPR